MTSAKKSDENRTEEFELPDSFKKQAEALKTQDKELASEVNRARSEQGLRKEDESTRAFQFRQLQLSDKIKELEERKKKTEKELALIMQRKNAAFHSDLKRATELLVSETKKIYPLEKELESGVSKINNIKNEMQILFENSIEARKKEGLAISEQSKEIQHLGSSLKDIILALRTEQKNFQTNMSKLNEELVSLLKTKSELSEKVLQLKGEETRLQGLEHDISMKQEERQKLQEELEIARKSLEELQRALERKASLEREVTELDQAKLAIADEIKKLKTSAQEMLQANTRLDYSLKETEEQLSGRRKLLLRIEDEVIEARKEVEKTRHEQLELQQATRRELQTLAQAQADLGHLEGEKAATLKRNAEIQALHDEKKEASTRELARLLAEHELRVTSMEQEFQKRQLARELELATFSAELRQKEDKLRDEFEKKKESWEEDFKLYCEKRHAELVRSLDSINAEDLEKIKANKNKFLLEVITTLENQLRRPQFSSTEEKVEEARSEVRKIFDHYFGNTYRWKFW